MTPLQKLQRIEDLTAKRKKLYQEVREKRKELYNMSLERERIIEEE
jgi:hypothetical protein